MFYLAGDDSPFLRATGIMLLIAREVREGGFDESRAQATIERVASRRLVMLVKGDERRLLGPPALVTRAQAFMLGL